ncbi:alpha/beta hydrolase [Glaciimonas sp. Gout2]|uniref:alpha/beta hydrolase n=2 Tax=Glaciimonas TaxID=1229970 RepID=UPI002AB4AEED|nr:MULTISPECIES: alpha/beta hydrolase [unclassified Glaciimonas]MDY7546224.1 alpha/beta hydrolase [Glaciimonas sp. CA11.2]MEB0010827.1 alpha/beta hydrolase [Glaciimonas sp. Cout2]MEB0081608.1 alpha/beta hydrolase [Glaciimonas sp. Gout2]
MNAQTTSFSITGPAGALECALDLPASDQFPEPRGLALVAHPHPLYGGTMDNKVAQTLARGFLALGYVAVRMNFRGVGNSSGVYDEGRGETDDMAALLVHMREKYPALPLALGGFSFGTFVQSQLQQRLITAGSPAERLVLVGTAAGKWPMPTVPANSILIHGELDETIPLSAVFEWARPQDIPVIVIPGADHFFHRRLQHIKNLMVEMWHRESKAG